MREISLKHLARFLQSRARQAGLGLSVLGPAFHWRDDTLQARYLHFYWISTLQYLQYLQCCSPGWLGTGRHAGPPAARSTTQHSISLYTETSKRRICKQRHSPSSLSQCSLGQISLNTESVKIGFTESSLSTRICSRKKGWDIWKLWVVVRFCLFQGRIPCLWLSLHSQHMWRICRTILWCINIWHYIPPWMADFLPS